MSRQAVRPRGAAGVPTARPGVSDTAARFAARAGRRRRGRLFRWLAACLAVASAVALAWLIGWSSVLDARELRVIGATGELHDEVAEAAAVEWGTPLARVDLDALAARVGEVAGVASATADRGWPHTVIVSVRPRVGAGVIRASGGWAVMDAGGVVFDRVREQPAGLPVIAAGTSMRERDVRAAALSVFRSLPPELAAAVQRTEASSADDVRLVLSSGAVVVWGSADQAARKAEVLSALMKQKAKTYDVRAPDMPTLRPR